MIKPNDFVVVNNKLDKSASNTNYDGTGNRLFGNLKLLMIIFVLFKSDRTGFGDDKSPTHVKSPFFHEGLFCLGLLESWEEDELSRAITAREHELALEERRKKLGTENEND